MLDCIIETAHAVSKDFVARPRSYRQAKAIANRLANLRVRTGHDPDWPDHAQRIAIYAALFGGAGAAGTSGAFAIAVDEVRKAAVAFSERRYDTGEPMLRSAFRDALLTFQSYLKTLDGAVTAIGAQQVSNIYKKSLKVLRDQSIAGVFGANKAPKKWPLDNGYAIKPDGEAAYLIEEMSRQLGLSSGPSSQASFVVLQRVAAFGAQVIAYAENYQERPGDEAAIDAMIGIAYRWHTALHTHQPRSVVAGPGRSGGRPAASGQARAA